jgi:hypothetical protein
MKALAIIFSIGIFVVGLLFGFIGKQDFEKHESKMLERIRLSKERLPLEYKRLQAEHRKCLESHIAARSSDLYYSPMADSCPDIQKPQLDRAHDERYEASRAEEMMVLGFMAAICGPVVIFLFYIFLTTVVFPGVKKGVETSVAVVQNKAASLRNSVQEAQARKVVENAVLDEAARVATRAAMTVFDEKEVAALQKQINDALAKGDYETAQTLMSTLRKIEGK